MYIFYIVVVKIINFGCNIIRTFKEGSERQLFDHPCLFKKKKMIKMWILLIIIPVFELVKYSKLNLNLYAFVHF